MYHHDYSAEGAHDEAMEASANLLQSYSRTSTRRGTSKISRGYSSDCDSSPMQTLEESSVSSKTSIYSSISSGLSSTGSDDSNFSQESDDIESEINFLQEKQTLLKRAIDAMKREDAYEASRARQTIEGKLERDSSPLWIEAKDVLDVLEEDEKGPSDGPRIVLSPVVDLEERPSKKTKIDVSTVSCVTSDSVFESSPSLINPIPSFFTVCEFDGPWVGQTLATTLSMIGHPSVEHLQGNSKPDGWQVVNDTKLGVLVVPPPLLTLSRGIELSDALALSTSARLVTMAMPPFCVVHANKAFCEMSGLVSGDVIGKPVESVLRVNRSSPGSDAGFVPSSDALTTTLVLANQKLCTVDLVPITDRFRNPSGGMSHILVQLHYQGVEDSSDTKGLTGSLLSKNLDIPGHHNRVVGTVG